MARLHLANALIRDYMENAIKGANESEEAPLLLRAREQYGEILARDSKNTAAMFGLASLNGPERVRESRELMLRVIVLDPKNKNAYYTLGTLDWQLAYKGIERAGRGSRGWLVVAQLPDASMRKALRDEWLPYLEEAFRVLQMARQMDAGDSKPLAYLNLVSRAKGHDRGRHRRGERAHCARRCLRARSDGDALGAQAGVVHGDGERGRSAAAVAPAPAASTAAASSVKRNGGASATTPSATGKGNAAASATPTASWSAVRRGYFATVTGTSTFTVLGGRQILLSQV
jgi:hypothetical protein